MVGTPLQAVLICGATWVLWKVLRQFVVKSALDNLPGPARNSYFFGMGPDVFYNDYCLMTLTHVMLTGNLPQLFNRYAWGFHKEIIHKYGPVTAIWGLFGVRSFIRAEMTYLIYSGDRQRCSMSSIRRPSIA